MSGDVRRGYQDFIDPTSRHLPNVDPLLVAVITQYEDSIIKKEVKAIITYTSPQKEVDEANLRNLGIIPDGREGKTNKLYVTMPMNLETLFELQKNKSIESIELNL